MTETKQKPNNYLVWAILTTVCCCLPAGIVAIVFANKVDSLWFAGKYEEAEDAANKAKVWTFISLGVGCVSGILTFFLFFISALLG